MYLISLSFYGIIYVVKQNDTKGGDNMFKRAVVVFITSLVAVLISGVCFKGSDMADVVIIVGILCMLSSSGFMVKSCSYDNE